MDIKSKFDTRITEEFLRTAKEDQRFDRKRLRLA